MTAPDAESPEDDARRAAQFEAYQQSPLGWLRDTLVWGALVARLGPAPLRILDAGCGPGALALRLAALGHAVTAVDSAPAMIDRARAAFAAAPPAVRARLTLAVANLDALPPDLTAAPYDAITCHNVLEFSPDPAATLARLAALLAPAGGLSLLVANRASDPLKTAITTGDLRGALRLLDPAAPRPSLMAAPKRAFLPDEVTRLCAGAGLRVDALRPVRVVADLLPAALLAAPAQRDRLLALEEALSARPEYAATGRMLWVWAVRPA
jgi:2-polyprenyl-3-methyl-5-hydroxy-6-metoxy-1,4-benzoquinol methylase